jgi:hypothetical protein
MLKGQGIGFVILMLAAIGLASLACRLGVRPTTSTPTVEVVAPALATQTRVPETPTLTQTTAPEPTATELATNPGKISITIDEAQLNSMVINALNKQSAQQLTNPTIHLRNGQILVNGEVNQSGLKASFSGTLTVDVTPDGRLHYNIVSASLGPLPLPQTMRDQVATQLNDSMGTPQTTNGQQIFVEDVKIGDGVMTITGHIR